MRFPDPTLRHALVTVVETVLKPLRPSAIYLFGSHGGPNERPDSDIDLAFLSTHLAPKATVADLAETLTRALGKEVDLIDLSCAPLTLRSQVVGEGECLACYDEITKDTFEMYTLSDYARLNEERAPILQAIRDEVNRHA
jgi:uncharacterized protein